MATRIDLFKAIYLVGIIAWIVAFLYWGFYATYEHRWFARALLFSTLTFNLVYRYAVYGREMKRREQERKADRDKLRDTS